MRYFLCQARVPQEPSALARVEVPTFPPHGGEAPSPQSVGARLAAVCGAALNDFPLGLDYKRLSKEKAHVLEENVRFSLIGLTCQAPGSVFEGAGRHDRPPRAQSLVAGT